MRRHRMLAGRMIPVLPDVYRRTIRAAIVNQLTQAGMDFALLDGPTSADVLQSGTERREQIAAHYRATLAPGLEDALRRMQEDLDVVERGGIGTIRWTPEHEAQFAATVAHCDEQINHAIDPRRRVDLQAPDDEQLDAARANAAARRASLFSPKWDPQASTEPNDQPGS